MDNALHLETPKLLWNVLKELRYSHPPLYSGTRHPLERGGYFILKKHKAIAPWTTFEEGCQDATRQALQVVCANNRHHLEHFEFVYLPYH